MRVGNDVVPSTTGGTRSTHSPIPDPCSGSRQFLQLHQVDSPLRQALSATPPPTTTSNSNSSSTPLLTASLNSPPVAHAHSKSPSPAPSSQLKANGSVDLSIPATLKRYQLHNSPPTSPSPSSSEKKQQSSAELYSHLLLQLRQSSPATSTPSAAAATTPVSSIKMTAANRKEKLKCQPSFQCPVCKKRFQRHIAMNAHFQNEHIGQVQNEKVCRLCSHRSKNIASIRVHLLKIHQIDLEKPGACLVEPEIKEINNNCIVSVAKDSNSNLTTPDTSRPSSPATLVIDIKKEPDITTEYNETSAVPRDLSLRQPRSSSDQVFHDRPSKSLKRTTNSPNPSTSASVNAKRYKRSGPPGLDQELGTDQSWRCQSCQIVFPNQTLYFLHRGFHSEANPWRCNSCGQVCLDMYDFNTHLVSVPHV